MKKVLAFCLVLAMILSMAGCGCNHQWEYATCQAPKTCQKCGQTEGVALAHVPGESVITAVDTTALTITYDLTCSDCGLVIETKTSATGTAPANGTIHISAAEWYACLDTNRQQLGAGQTLYPYPAESEDNALLHAIVSMSQMFAVFSYRDAEGNVITTDQQDTRNLIHNIYMEAQFTNDNAKEFFMLLMVILINNNGGLELEDANALVSQIMGGSPVSDNGYIYSMEILSVQDHKVGVSITVE